MSRSALCAVAWAEPQQGLAGAILAFCRLADKLALGRGQCISGRGPGLVLSKQSALERAGAEFIDEVGVKLKRAAK